METTVLERFLKYIAVDTMSQLEKESIPSTEKQKNLARILEEELKAMGASDVKADDHAYYHGGIILTGAQTEVRHGRSTGRNLKKPGKQGEGKPGI